MPVKTEKKKQVQALRAVARELELTGCPPDNSSQERVEEFAGTLLKHRGLTAEQRGRVEGALAAYKETLPTNLSQAVPASTRIFRHSGVFCVISLQ